MKGAAAMVETIAPSTRNSTVLVPSGTVAVTGTAAATTAPLARLKVVVRAGGVVEPPSGSPPVTVPPSVAGGGGNCVGVWGDCVCPLLQAKARAAQSTASERTKAGWLDGRRCTGDSSWLSGPKPRRSGGYSAGAVPIRRERGGRTRACLHLPRMSATASSMRLAGASLRLAALS